MKTCSDNGRGVPGAVTPRPVPAGRGVGKRPAWPADDLSPAFAQAWLTSDFGASPEGVMTVISTLTAAGSPARNATPSNNALLADNAVPVNPGPVNPGPAATAGRGALPLPGRVPSAALTLLRTARHGLAEAETETDAGTRYIGAHLAALRAAAAIVAARGEPGSAARRRRPRSVWELLPQVEPTLAEWAAFFAAGAAKGAAAEAGLPRAAVAQEAGELLCYAATFLTVAERALGVESEPMLPLSLRHAS
jgi:SAV_6107-like HEPN